MHTRRLRSIAVALLTVVGATLALAAPAGAEGAGDPPVDDDGSDLVGRVEDQINDINEGNPGGGASEPPSCDWTELKPNGDEVERDDGVLRWREPGQGHDFWDDSEPGEGGTIFRYECWHDDMTCRTPAPTGHGCLGEAVDATWCGSFLCRFPDVNPENIALLAVDQFVRNLPPPQPHFNPPDGVTYVNFPTWMWVEGVPGDGQIDAPTISVPGITVHTTAELDKVTWTMGDGGEVDCPLTVTEASAEAECTYAYTRSSANQPNNTYTGQASTVWVATWTVEENGATGTVDAPRSTDFDLQVAEVQTIVR